MSFSTHLRQAQLQFVRRAQCNCITYTQGVQRQWQQQQRQLQQDTRLVATCVSFAISQFECKPKTTVGCVAMCIAPATAPRPRPSHHPLSLSLFVFFCVFRLPAMGDLQLIAELHNCAFPCIFLSQRRVGEGQWGKGRCAGGFGGCIFSFNSLGICYLLPVSIAHEVLLLLLLLLFLLFIMGHILSLENGVLSRSAQLMHVSTISLARAAQLLVLLHSLAGTVTHISQAAKKRSCLIN